jgi:hypothetical protein
VKLKRSLVLLSGVLMVFYLRCLLDQVICAAWLYFEEEYGTLEDYDQAVLKVSFVDCSKVFMKLKSKLLDYFLNNYRIVLYCSCYFIWCLIKVLCGEPCKFLHGYVYVFI